MVKLYPDDSYTLHTDAYQINMMQTYWRQGLAERKAIFEVYFRKLPFQNGYAIFAGLERIVDYIQNLRFTKHDLAYLKEIGDYPDDFIEYLRNFKFKATIRSVVEGEVVFNNEPLLQVEGPLVDCQLVETAILNIVNYQTLIATKAARVRSACGDDALLELEHGAHKNLMQLCGGRGQPILEALMRPAMYGQLRFLGSQLVEHMLMP